jgi:hypothetical protein
MALDNGYVLALAVREIVYGKLKQGVPLFPILIIRRGFRV